MRYARSSYAFKVNVSSLLFFLKNMDPNFDKHKEQFSFGVKIFQTAWDEFKLTNNYVSRVKHGRTNLTCSKEWVNRQRLELEPADVALNLKSKQAKSKIATPSVTCVPRTFIVTRIALRPSATCMYAGRVCGHGHEHGRWHNWGGEKPQRPGACPYAYRHLKPKPTNPQSQLQL